jgi:ankyrin repeat protein
MPEKQMKTATIAKLKALALVGPHMRESYIMLRPVYENKNEIMLIGDGERLLTNADLALADGLIDRHTRIDIYSHGHLDKRGIHYINLVEAQQPTVFLFEMLAKSAMNDPLQIHLWSCYSGALKNYIYYLPIGSVLITHAQHNKTLFIEHVNFITLNNSSFNNIFVNLLEDYEKYLGHYFQVIANLGMPVNYENNQPANIISVALNDPEQYAHYKLSSLLNVLNQINQIADKFKVEDRAFESVQNYDLILSVEKTKTFLSYTFIEHCGLDADSILNIITSPLYPQLLMKMDQELAEVNCLFNSIDAYHVDVVNIMIKRIVKANKDHGIVAKSFIYAASKGYADIIQSFLEHGINPNSQSYDGVTALSIASQNGYLEIVQALLTDGADVNLQDKNGCSALQQASKNGHWEIVKELLSHGANPNLYGLESGTALSSASKKGHLDIVKELLSHGADTNYQDYIGATALLLASQEGHLDIVKTLVNNGANPNLLTTNGYSALSIASHRGQLNVVKELLSYGVDPNIGWNYDNKPLTLAIKFQHAAIVGELLRHGANLDILDIWGSHSLEIQKIINTHLSTQLIFDELPSIRIKKADEYFPAHKDNYNNYECKNTDHAVFSFSMYDVCQLNCAPELELGMFEHDEF